MKNINKLFLSAIFFSLLTSSEVVNANEIKIKNVGQIELKKASFTANAKSETFSNKSMDPLYSDYTEFKEDIGAAVNIVSIVPDNKLDNIDSDLESLISKKEISDDKYLEEKAKKESLEKEKAKKAEEQAKKDDEQAKKDEEKRLKEEADKAALEKKESESKQSEENKTKVQSSGFASPLKQLNLTSGFGLRDDPTGISGNDHNGIDLSGPLNEPVMASRGGTVTYAGLEGSAGNHVIIQHDNGYYTYYLHLNSISVSTGQTVKTGDIVGLMGTTGNSTGVHLHFSIATSGSWTGFVDPGPFIGMY